MMKKLVKLLQEKQLTIAGYESLTGGLFSYLITNIPNASKVFLGSIITYTNKVKVNIGHVPKEIINRYGVISPQTAQAMAIACHDVFNSDIAISFTGNAGPQTLDHLPVGKVFLGIFYQNQPTIVELSLNPNWSREQIKLATVETMVEHIFRIITTLNKENK